MSVGYPVSRAARRTTGILLVLAALSILPAEHASATTRPLIEMGDPDISNKSLSGPGQAATSPSPGSSRVGKYRPSLLWLTYLRILISVRATTR
jgi:hypothetical protein